MVRDKLIPVALLVIGVGLIWFLSFTLVGRSDLDSHSSSNLSALLFGAASVALFVFSILFAVLAIFSWHAIQAVNSKLDLMATEMRGRLHSILGYVVGEMSLESDFLTIKDEDRMAEAVRLCQQGYDLLKKVGGPAEYMGLNNLVYYSCVSKAPHKDQQQHQNQHKADFLVSKARLLKEAGQEHNAPSLQLTACRAILLFGDEKEKMRARETLEALSAAPDILEKERKEARAYLTHLSHQR